MESEEKYERIGGSATGGGTFWGLGSLMTKAKSFDELLELAENGDHRSVDMLVKDIYGGNYNAMGLTSDLIACSFGKTIRFTGDETFCTRELSMQTRTGPFSCLLCQVEILGTIVYMEVSYCK